jgi:probable rRNA maturation factor
METDIKFEGLDVLAKKWDMPATDCASCIESICSDTIARLNKLPSQVKTLELSVVFLTADDIHKINLKYRRVDAPTDVLSFPLWEDENGFFAPPDDWDLLPLGDILICSDVVAGNAADNGKTFEEELILVLFHGFLHLIGFDHDTKEKQDLMWNLQNDMVQNYFKELVR